MLNSRKICPHCLEELNSICSHAANLWIALCTLVDTEPSFDPKNNIEDFLTLERLGYILTTEKDLENCYLRINGYNPEENSFCIHSKIHCRAK